MSDETEKVYRKLKEMINICKIISNFKLTYTSYWRYSEYKKWYWSTSK